MFIGLSILLVIAIIVLSVWKHQLDGANAKHVENQQEHLVTQFPVPSATRSILAGLAGLAFCVGIFHNVFFYAEPGYKYHVRTILGTEKAVDSVGYNMHLFGRKNAWKKSMSIVAKYQYTGTDEDKTVGEVQNRQLSSSILGPVNTIFLDQVDSQISATARFMLPSDEESFLKIARQYRSPDNLIRTTLLPAFQETIQATAALMGAEDYFAGKRTEFNMAFEAQLKGGLYLVNRREKVVRAPQYEGKTSANASKDEQEGFGDDDKVIFVVEKILDKDGVPVRKAQSYTALGITVLESRITDVVPNEKFKERMQLKQKASADRAIAREQRIQEEEQKLLAEATGDRQVAEKKASALVDQIERTTKAETTKQLALTAANQQKEAAEIDRKKSEILLAKAQIDAQAVKVTADADAYKKRVVLKADNALAQKLDAEIAIQKVWAEAFAKRAVPTTVFTSGVGGGTSTGSDTDVTRFMQLMTVQAAKSLAYDRGVGKVVKK